MSSPCRCPRLIGRRQVHILVAVADFENAVQQHCAAAPRAILQAADACGTIRELARAPVELHG
eukprot:11194307-Lingulodinium_polyedra.AAC.1